MNRNLSAVTDQVRDLLRRLTPAQKAAAAVAAIAFVVLIFGFTRLEADRNSGKTVLFAGLDPAVASEVTSALDVRGVAYTLGDGGRSVYVDESQVYQLRVQLAGEGLPATGPAGYELLESESLTTSDFRQRVDFQRALEGELSRTIQAYGPIKSAIVRLALPDDNAFVTGRTATTASVLIDTRHDIDAQTVEAIVHLVANAVPELDIDGVTVSNTNGRLLSANGKTTGMAGDADEREAAVSAALSAEAEALLSAAFGPGNARVSVRAELDFAERETLSETYGGEGTPVSEKLESEAYLGSTPMHGGILGPDDGLQPELNADTADIDYERASEERNYAVDKITEQVRSDGGAIRRLTVAVLVDDDVEAGDADVARVVSAAVGVNEERGDIIEVAVVPFTPVELEEIEDEDDGGQNLLALIIVGGLLALSMLVAAVLVLRKSKASAAANTPEAPAFDAVVDDEDDDEDDETVEEEPAPPAVPADLLEFDLPPAQTPPPVVTELVDSDPQRVADVLRVWMEEQ